MNASMHFSFTSSTWFTQFIIRVEECLFIFFLRLLSSAIEEMKEKSDRISYHIQEINADIQVLIYFFL